MFDDVMGAYGSRFLLAAGGVGLALLVLIGIFWILRSRAPSPFVRGGKNRQPRLQVLDAAAVDTRRRLVLVRRDDVEHLIMIGGPTDIVIESRIGQESEGRFEPAFKPIPAPQPTPVIAAPEPPVMPQPKLAAPVEREAEAPEVRTPTPAVEPRSGPPERVVAAHPAPAPAIPPMAAPPVPAANIEPETAPSAPQPPIIPKAPERPAAPVVEAASAADVLDAARQRVLPQQRLEPQLSTRPAQSPPTVEQDIPVVRGDAAAAAPKSSVSDFERILQEEMDNTLAAQRVAPVASAPARPAPSPSGSLPRRDPEMAPITGADSDLQKEVARIFGEMSVNREK
ncbi:flagellar biosynthesis protein FliO [Rhizobium sp. P32RR-XVIII]|uniref:flagellar biosynthetic protein FliO n=1 Tax=Rhizobium sp. P32RR-XVIII TaxID=2726738 RepID=UPI001456C11C|nr:flagellar biosynthetic protein FliO [Rhizobium sp. P32RR-XVIII]NLS05134.1 flagellar biosynthesis protein FliO [Rhizobium sp. P32RR-XVIII]